MAVVKHTAMNLVRAQDDKHGLRSGEKLPTSPQTISKASPKTETALREAIRLTT